MTQFIEELGPLRSLTTSETGAVTDIDYAEQLAADQFYRVYSIVWMMNPGAADEINAVIHHHASGDVNLAYIKSTSLTTLQGTMTGPIDTKLGGIMSAFRITANAGTVARLNVVYRVVTVRQINGQPITPACTIWQRLLGVC